MIPDPDAAAATLLLDAVDVGLLVIGADERVEFVNRWIADRLHPDVQLLGRQLQELADPPIEPRLVSAVQAALTKGHSKRLAHAFHPTPLPLYSPDSSDGERLRQAVDVIAQSTGPRGVRQCLVQVRDMTEIVRREQQLKEQTRRLAVELDRVKLAQAELERQSMRFRELARLAPVGLLEVDAIGTICFFNERATNMLQLAPESAEGKWWIDQLPIPMREGVAARWQSALARGADFDTEICVASDDGSRTWLRLESTTIGGLRSLGLGHIVTVTDVTVLRESAERLEHRANHDPLTGLANRERLGAALAEAIRASDGRVAVLFIDLDRFKPVNDRHGHTAGDAVLKAVAERLQRTMRAHDTVGRLGGDEFGVVVRHAPEDAVLAGLIRRIRDALAAPVPFEGRELCVGASVGIAVCPQDGTTAQALLDAADQDMYRNKVRTHTRAAAGATLAPH